MKPEYRYVHSFAEVIAAYRDGAERSHALGPRHAQLLREQRENARDFYGGEPEQVLRYLTEGYDPTEATDASIEAATFEGRAPAWRFNDEDGDYEHDLFMSGEPEYYLDRIQVPGKPGVHVEVGLSICNRTPARVIGEYGLWVSAALKQINALGHDVQLSVHYQATQLYDEHDEVGRAVVVVKRFGEMVLPQDFLVMFSRCGLRHLLWTGVFLEETNGLRPTTFLGYPDGTDWAVGWDPDTRVLHIEAPKTSTTFPKEDMDHMLREATLDF